MSYNTVIPRSNAFKQRNVDNTTLFSTIHRAVVTEVNLINGTVKVSLEGVKLDRIINFPVLGLSIPLIGSNNEVDFSQTSWGRYIPQNGDVLLVCFSPTGEVYAVGQTSRIYSTLDSIDQDYKQKKKGGIGWGVTSRAELKPGDWDFKSSRGSFLYLGDRIRLSSGISSISINQSIDDMSVTTTSKTINNKSSNSIIRFGSAKRLIPIDPNKESFVINPLNLGGPAQEFSVYMNRSMPLSAPGVPPISIARLSVGDVVDDLTFLPMVSTQFPPNTVFYYLATYSAAGLPVMFEHKIDSLGNNDVSALTASKFDWTTPAAAWNVTNLSTSMTSTTTTTLTATSSLTLESATINLGTGATDFIIKGTTFNQVLDGVLTTLNTACTSGTSADPVAAAVIKAISAACLALQAALPSWLSVKTKTI